MNSKEIPWVELGFQNQSAGDKQGSVALTFYEWINYIIILFVSYPFILSQTLNTFDWAY